MNRKDLIAIMAAILCGPIGHPMGSLAPKECVDEAEKIYSEIEKREAWWVRGGGIPR
jgi:hypothetical protein